MGASSQGLSAFWVHEEKKISLQDFFRMFLTEKFAQLSFETLKYYEHQLFHVGDSFIAY